MSNNIITIQRDGLNAEKLGTCVGDALEVLAAACEFPAFEECWENNLDWMSENMAEAFKQYNHENALIEALNEAGADAKPIFEQCGEDAQEYAGYISAYSAPDQPLQLGAFMALQHPVPFARMVTAWTDAQRDAMHECLGDFRPGLYPPLAKHLQDAYEWYEKYALNEYLNGDRSDVGLLGKARRVLALESVRYNEKTGVITLEYDPDSDELRELYGLQEALDYAESDKERAKILRAWDWTDMICKHIEDRAARYIAKEKEAAARRRAENEKTRAYQQQRRDESEAARIAKLEAMKKTQ